MTDPRTRWEIDELAAQALGGLSRRELLRRGAALGAVPTFAALLAACGSDDEAGGRKLGDSLVILETDVAPGLDADGPAVAQAATQTIYAQTYEPLLTWARGETKGGVINPDFRKYEPRLAESWQQDGLEWTFKLRQGVKSAAGNELTTDDVLWTMNRIKAVLGTSLGWFLLNVGGVLTDDVFAKGATAEDKKIKDEVVAIDQYTFKVKQFQPSPLLLTVLPVLALGIIDSKEAKKHVTSDDPWAHKWLDTSGTAGFGAYSVQDWQKGESITLTANPNYYRGKAAFKTVVFRRVPQSGSRVTGIQRGQAQIVTALAPKEFDAVAKDKNVDTLDWFGNVFLAIGPNYKFEPWAAGGDKAKSKLLRQALAYAIPYDEIIKRDFFGRAKQWNGLISSSFYGAHPIERYKYDPEKAKALLAEAGHADGSGLTGPGLTLTYIAEHASWVDPVVNRIKTAFAEIGINLKLDPIPQAQFVDRESNKDDIPFTLLDQQIAIGTDAGYQSQLNFVTPDNGGLDNSTNYVSKEFDDLYLKQKSETNEEKRLSMLTQMQEILMEDLPRIPILERATQIGVQSGLTGWAPRPDLSQVGEIFSLKAAT